MDSIQIEASNCNNFDSAMISIAVRKLNIKFAPNGTGKSSLAKALSFALKGDDNLMKELMPFKLRGNNPDKKQPHVKVTGTLNSVMCFNEEYVDQFLFKKELLSNSFDILVRNEAYTKRENEIDELVGNIKRVFSGNQEFESLIATLNEMGGAFKLSKTGLDKKSTGTKGLLGGNKIQHIPLGLEPYTAFIQGANSVGWIDWQTKGYEFIELSDSCPFCTSHAADKTEQIKKVGQEYDKSTIKNLVGIISVIEKLGDYFSDEAKVKLTEIANLKDGIAKEHEDFLVTVKTQIDTFTEKLETLRTLSGFQFKDGEKVAAKLLAYKIDLKFFAELSSDKMQQAITPINSCIDQVIAQGGLLQGKINQQRSEMGKTVARHQKDINEFLAYAGYSYAVSITGEDDQAQLKLRHVDHDEHLTGGSQHLSFGERNAFAIVLFMYECLAKKPDLIILDDPISSFDKNKKYAILEMLFRRDADLCLKSKTVLMLTHDVEPIIDTIRSLEKQFSNQTSSAFLKFDAGCIVELAIGKDDVQTFFQICESVLASGKHDVIKLIYMRRNYEIANNKGDAYQVLSNVFKKRKNLTDTRQPRGLDGEHPGMDAANFANGCAEITKWLPTFLYADLVNKITDVAALRLLYNESINGYEKLQVFRLLGLQVGNSVIQKFINESYHIENEFICQLDPAKFDTVPRYVIAECDKLLALHGT